MWRELKWFFQDQQWSQERGETGLLHPRCSPSTRTLLISIQSSQLPSQTALWRRCLLSLLLPARVWSAPGQADEREKGQTKEFMHRKLFMKQSPFWLKGENNNIFFIKITLRRVMGKWILWFGEDYDAVKVLHSICQQIWKTQQWPQDWKRSVFIPIPKKCDAKEWSNCHTIALISQASK